jgi:hypothetical protein
MQDDLEEATGCEAGEWFLSDHIFDTVGSDRREALMTSRIAVLGFPS